MLAILTRFFLSVSSFSGVLYFYVVTNLDTRISNFLIFDWNILSIFWIRHLIYLAIFALFALITLMITERAFPRGDKLQALEVKPIESVAVPTYISMFVIALGLSTIDNSVSLVVLLILFLFWTRLEKIFYFNPIWLFFGYRFYEIKSSNENTYTLITKKDRLKGKQSQTNLRRLNNYTFLEN